MITVSNKELNMPNQNILLLLFDSFRADEFNGDQSNSIAPNIDNLVHNGVYFDHAVSVSDATLISWSGLFTAKYPFRTGIRSSRFNKLNENTVTYFQILKNHGYHFYGILPTLSETIGLFPEFENHDSLYELHKGLYDGIGQSIIDKLDSKSMAEPWFFVIHLMDLHSPLTVPSGFEGSKYGKNSYEKIISSIDVWIGKIKNKINDNTMLIITADHGSYIKSLNIDGKSINYEESIQSQTFISSLSKKVPRFMQPIKNKIFITLENKKHKQKLQSLSKFTLKPHQKRALLSGRADKDHFLYDETIRIPLLFVSKNIPKGKIISQQVRSVDIMPTICELSQILNPNDIDGVGLLPLIQGKNMQENPAYIESTPLVLSNSNDVIGIRTSEFKYFRDANDSKKRVHLFDLKTDPFEDENISSNKPHLVDEFESILQNIIKNKSVKKDNDLESEEIETELRKLGYV